MVVSLSIKAVARGHGLTTASSNESVWSSASVFWCLKFVGISGMVFW